MMRFTSNQKVFALRKREAGATLVEAAIVFPVILLLFLLIVEAFIYMARLAVMNYAVQEGVILASTVEGLRSPDAGIRDAALQRVRDRTWQFSSWVLGDPSKYQAPGGEIPPVIVTVGNNTTPIRVQLWASYVPINPLLMLNGPITIRAQALAYRDEGPEPPARLPNCEEGDPRPECQCSNGQAGAGLTLCSCSWPYVENEFGACVCSPTIVCDEPKILNTNTCQCVCPTRDCGQGMYYDTNTCSCRCSPQSCPDNQYWDSNSCSCKCDCWRLEEYCRINFHHKSRCVNNAEGVVACECTDECYGGYTGENCETCERLTCNPPFTFFNEDTCRCECPRPRGDGECRALHACSYYRWDTCSCACNTYSGEESHIPPFTGSYDSCSPPESRCRDIGKQHRTVTRATQGVPCSYNCLCPGGVDNTGDDSCGGGSG